MLPPLATVLRASMSRPESVSSRRASLGSRTASWRISLRFFSPPEKPSLTARFMRSGLSSISRAFCSMSLLSSRTGGLGGPPAATWRSRTWRRGWLPFLLTFMLAYRAFQAHSQQLGGLHGELEGELLED